MKDYWPTPQGKAKAPWIIAVDLDGTLCKSISPDKYAEAKPIQENIDKSNRLAEMGHRIFIYTSRSWATYDLTENWLKRHGVKYEALMMGKLLGHMYIDDHNYTFEGAIDRLKED